MGCFCCCCGCCLIFVQTGSNLVLFRYIYIYLIFSSHPSVDIDPCAQGRWLIEESRVGVFVSFVLRMINIFHLRDNVNEGNFACECIVCVYVCVCVFSRFAFLSGKHIIALNFSYINMWAWRVSIEDTSWSIDYVWVFCFCHLYVIKNYGIIV